MKLNLPIDDVLDDISDILVTQNRLVISAPPGAGKTTKVPLHLLQSFWLGADKIIMLEPRRIAARRAAERMAEMLGERVGQTIGLRSRLDTRVSKATRIEVVTEGVFTNQIVRDPDLPAIGAVLFDEFHERSLDADLGLALALETQAALNENLRIIVMSATLEVEKIKSLLDASVVESKGRAFPVETIYIGRTKDRLEDQMAKAIRRGISSQTGSILAFLPGVAEIKRTVEGLADLPENVVIAPLYGALSPKDQDNAIKPAPDGKRKIVIATDIAESSLTIEGVRVVIDAGLARVPEYRAGGLGVSLKTVKTSIANVDQRQGRAGRTEPGICYRLWHEEENRGLPKAPPPEILNADLSAMILKLADWGSAVPFELKWLDPPSRGQVEQANASLIGLGFLSKDRTLTEHGRAAARLPMSPRLAALILAAETDGERAMAARLAAMLSEHGMGGKSSDLSSRFDRFLGDTSPRAKSLKTQSRNWAGTKANPDGDLADLLARAWPDQIGKNRDAGSGRYQLAGGGGAVLPSGDPMIGSDWLIVCETGGHTKSDPVIRLALPITEAIAKRHLIETNLDTAEYDTERKTVRALRQKMLGKIVLSETPLKTPDNVVVANAIKRAVSLNGFAVLPEMTTFDRYMRRVMFALNDPKEHGLREAQLIETFSDWLEPLIVMSGERAAKGTQILDALKTKMGWELTQKVESLAPKNWMSPTGRTHPIDYESEQAPLVSIRVQDVYGQTVHPVIGERQTPLTLSLLSPAQRQVALTRDLPSFWTGGYGDMRKDMKGRYPKHDWPDDPANASPRKPKNP